jgi:hypothetical protein
MFCATFTAAAQEDWFRRRDGWYRFATFCVLLLRCSAGLCCEHVYRYDEEVCCRASEVASRDVRLAIELVSFYFSGRAEKMCNWAIVCVS